ncbi:uncharacterized protein LOC121891968 [Thunnus maccoyii]|uniref:uncharacterized protein LOC121891968 n=1 Tax=Thunnus maccoyii TaxID=8240 RepID=UPI001C4B86F5|nr:uncharacterized protein LOC121891968 [Thunnus maccoyii]
MDGWKQCFFLLLPLCADTKVTVVKTTGREPVITPVCMNENLGVIVVLTCRISTRRHWGEACQLLYTHDKKFNQECDSRFTLMTENQTIFLCLTSLTPVDSGNYSCECSYERGTHPVHLDITVEAEEEGGTFSGMRVIATAVITVTVTATFIMAAGIICGPILRRNNHRQNTSSGASELTRTETPCVLEEDPYTSLQQPASDVYQTISNQLPDSTSVSVIISRFYYQETDNEEDFHPVYSVYETI